MMSLETIYNENDARKFFDEVVRNLPFDLIRRIQKGELNEEELRSPKLSTARKAWEKIGSFSRFELTG
jgi:hypothetical protein